MLRRISWVFGVLSVLVPTALYLWQRWQHQKLMASGLNGDELGWILSVVLVDVFLAGLIALVAVIMNVTSLYLMPKDSEYNPVVRVIEIVLLALPMMACLFFLGVTMMH